MLDNALRNLVHCEFKIGKFTFAFLDCLLAVCITGAGVLMREAIFGIAENPGLGGGMMMLGYCALDVVLAFLMAVFIWKTTGSKLRTVGVYSLAVIWPVFAGNSALNGGDEVITAVVLVMLLAVFAVMKGFEAGKFWLFTALVCGFQILQSDGAGAKLTNCWPNVYTLFSETGFLNEYGYAGKLFVFGALLIVLYYISKQKFSATPKLLVYSGLFFSLFISFFYPFMNYRSGFFANVFAILLFVLDKKKFYVPMFLCIISYVSYALFHVGTIGIFPWVYALGVLALTMDAGVNLYKEVHTGN